MKESNQFLNSVESAQVSTDNKIDHTKYPPKTLLYIRT